MIKGLRKLEKISRDQKSKSYVVTEDGEDEDSYGMFGEQNNPDYVWVGEDDLSEIYEESDLQEALTTYQEVRRVIREQRYNRGAWHKGKGKDQRRGTGPFRQRGHAGAHRVHVDMLKLRTKCARCGQIGHWTKECTGVPDAYARGKAESSKSRHVGSKMSGKSKFFSAQVHDNAAAGFWLDLDGGNYVPVLGDFLKKESLFRSFLWNFNSSSAWSSGHSCSIRAHWGGGIGRHSTGHWRGLRCSRMHNCQKGCPTFAAKSIAS